mmetsp:Transcript_36332/g.116411  ORF Transcript_36332/g.116411 Transcript_36332/m.116411 type:complete len:180 (-) Transcript_36332:911-1450(-)
MSIAEFYIELQQDGYGYDENGDWDPNRAYDEKIYETEEAFELRDSAFQDETPSDDDVRFTGALTPTEASAKKRERAEESGAVIDFSNDVPSKHPRNETLTCQFCSKVINLRRGRTNYAGLREHQRNSRHCRLLQPLPREGNDEARNAPPPFGERNKETNEGATNHVGLLQVKKEERRPH